MSGIGPSVVIVEDCPVASACLERMVRAMGFHVFTATDGVEGLRLIGRVDPAVCILDHDLPTLSGQHIAMVIRSFRGPTPIIGITAGRTERGLRAGMDLVLPKPISREGLASALEQVIPTACCG